MHISTVDLELTASFAQKSPAPRIGYFAGFLDDDELAFYLFQLHGTGSHSPYLNSMVHMAFQHPFLPGASPACAINKINRSLLHHLNSLDYITAFFGVIDLRRNQLRYCNAHFGEAWITDPTDCTEPLKIGGGFLGLREGCDFPEGCVTLSEGDEIIVPYSVDGKKRETFSCRIKAPARKAVYLSKCGIPDSPNLHIKTIHDFDQMKEHIRALMSETDKIGYSLRFLKNFRLVLVELITNAIIHGNRYDREKKCVVLSDIKPERVLLGVIDEGTGYNLNAIPDPLRPENISKPHGRGLFIIKHYVDYFDLRGNGNCTVVTFNRSRDC